MPSPFVPIHSRMHALSYSCLQLIMEEVFSSHAFLVLVTIFLASAIVHWIISKAMTMAKAKTKAFHLPPSPPALPIIGHLHLLRPPINQALHKLNARHGPLLRLYLGSTPCVVVSTADHARELFKAHDASCADRPQSFASRQFAYGSAGFAFAPHGPYWRFVRRLCMSELLGGRTLEQLRPIRRAELLALLRTVLAASRRLHESLDLSRELIKFTNNMIMRMATSTTSSAAAAGGGEPEEARELAKQVAELVGAFNMADHIKILGKFDLQGLNRRIKEVHRKFDALLERIIKAKEGRKKEEKLINIVDGGGEAEEGVKDLLDILLAVAEDENAEIKLSRDNIKAFILDIFTAGSDSSAATVEWALAELTNHPPVLQQVREEIDRVVGAQRIVDESDLPDLPNLRAVMKEVMRLHPAAPLALREATRDIKLGGFDVPANTTVFVNAWSIGRDAAHWADPLEFRPERFVAPAAAAAVDVRGQHFQLVPFGGGRRVCPGMQLALQVTSATVAALVQCFEWEADGGGGGKVDMEEGTGLVIAKAKPLMLVPLPRLHPFPSI